MQAPHRRRYFSPMRRPATTHYDFALTSSAARGRRLGLALSVTFHVLLVALLLVPLRHDFQRVLDPGRRDGRRAGGGGGGGEREAYISLPAPVAAPRAAAVEVNPPEHTPPPVPVTPTPTPPVEIPPPVAETPPAVAVEPSAAVAATGDSAAGAGAGAGQGGGAGGGVGGGIGPGVGPGTGAGVGDSGSGGQGRGPRPRHQVLPPEGAPKELRGKLIRVLFAIDPTGRVRRVSFDPPISDGKYADRLKEAMLAYRYHPALGPDGAPVASSYEMTISVY